MYEVIQKWHVFLRHSVFTASIQSVVMYLFLHGKCIIMYMYLTRGDRKEGQAENDQLCASLVCSLQRK